MNIQDRDIMKTIFQEKITTQKILSEKSGHSIGIVNRSVKYLKEKKYIDDNFTLTKKGRDYLENSKPKNAIILAAGFGMRMVPVNMSIPKALLKVNEDTLIARLIKQLKEKGIDEIYIVVGFQREKFEYLIDKYNVKLIVNPEYATKNNLHSLNLAAKYIEDTYIIPCDIYSKENPFDEYELYSYYMLTDKTIENPEFRVNRNMEIVKPKSNEEGNRVIGISYISKEDSIILKENLSKLDKDKSYDNSFWEEALYDKNKMVVSAKIIEDEKIVEVDTYKDLYELDKDSEHLKSEAIDTIKKALLVDVDEIEEIQVLKKGMTNRSFLFSANGKKYIMRIPGEGTEKLINRREEAEVYGMINGKNICDDVVYINPDNGYKITEFIPNGRSCDSYNMDDLKKCMDFLKKFHKLKLKVDHEFKIFDKIEFYESLWGSIPSAYPDYLETKRKVFSLKKYIDENVDEKILTHIDAVPDNFLIIEKNGEKDIRLLDWEYAGMQDPHIDIAMFSIYALYDKNEVDRLIDVYFDNNCEERTRTKIYAYVAACGLLWSNWCEYKRNLGVEFGEYSLKQYRYAKEFYRIVKNKINE